MTTRYTVDLVTHYRADYAEGYDQPNPVWTHDSWFMAYCGLCAKDEWGPGAVMHPKTVKKLREAR